jgi:hypothetical protein
MKLIDVIRIFLLPNSWILALRAFGLFFHMLSFIRTYIFCNAHALALKALPPKKIITPKYTF